MEQPIPAPQPIPSSPAAVSEPPLEYAGFGRRFLAKCVDF